MNSWWMTPAEKKIDEDIRKMPGDLGAKAIVPHQHKSIMESPAEMANYLAIHTKLLAQNLNRPLKALDVGTYSGRSALAIAQAMEELPHGGEVISCEFTPDHAAFAHEHLKESKAGQHIKVVVGKASDTMQGLIHDGQEGKFDLVFIDADKLGYNDYYEKALKLLRTGGMIIIDNPLWSLQVLNPTRYNDEDTVALSRLNNKISMDPRVDAVLTGNEDGVWTILKRSQNKFKEMVADHAAEVAVTR